MLIKALCSFSGIITMIPGEVRDVTEETGRDLIRAGFAVIEGEVEIKEATSEKETDPDGAEPDVPEPVEDEPKKEAVQEKTSCEGGLMTYESIGADS